jgi:hypothetical protein
MAWNPSPEVAVARDAAKRLGADRCVLIYTKPDGVIGAASYGKTRALCEATKPVCDRLFDVAMDEFADFEHGGL